MHCAVTLSIFETLYTSLYYVYDASGNLCILKPCPEVWAEHTTMFYYGLRVGDMTIWTGQPKSKPGLVGEFPQFSKNILPQYGDKVALPPAAIQARIAEFYEAG